jgi:CheY-like chemotaxis protein
MTKILCVDDDPSILSLYQEELSAEGYSVSIARDGKEAVVQFTKENPHLVIMDIRMPQMGGIEALNTILGKNRQIPVILNTAYPQYKQNFMTWGADAYVVKSSDLTELKEKIREVIEQKGKASSP